MTAPSTRRPVGRPVTAPEPRRGRPIQLSEAEYKTAQRLGNGNASAGVRRALELAESRDVDTVSNS